MNEISLAGLPCALRMNAPRILSRALKEGVIAPKEIAAMVPKSIAEHEDQFREVMRWFYNLFQLGEVVIVNSRLSMQIKNIREKKKSLSDNEVRGHGENYIMNLYLRDIRRFELISNDEMRLLGREVRQEGNVDARNELIIHNLRLVLKFAAEYSTRATGALEYIDLVQEGNLGLLSAAEKYDYRKENHFSTYVWWWVMEHITRALDDLSQTVRQPVHMRELVRRVRRISGEFLAEKGRSPRVEEISEILQAPQDKIKQALRFSQKQLSLDEPLYTDGDEWASLKDIISAQEYYVSDIDLDPLGALEQGEVFEQAQKKIGFLVACLEDPSMDERWRKIFKARYGLDGTYTPKTLQEVGDQFHVTRERIRQIAEIVWERLAEFGIDRNNTEAMLTEDSLECFQRLKEEI